MVLERTQHFAPADVEQNLCVLMLMLPAAARQTKETLRMFRDSGGFDAFFPSEEDYAGHTARLNEMPNLDTFDAKEFSARQIKTSLGNTLRLLSPLIILDEGQKAYSQLARKTIEGFNPCMVVELSAKAVVAQAQAQVTIQDYEAYRALAYEFDRRRECLGCGYRSLQYMRKV